VRARWFTDLGSLSGASFDADWGGRVRHGVPGPIYAVSSGAERDPTETVGYCADGGFVWRQPRSTMELEDTVGRLSGGWLIQGNVGIDGDDHWTLDGIRAWWMLRAAHAAAYRDAGIPDVARYFESELPDYLRAYAFFLEHGRRPSLGDELPDIDAPLAIAIAPPTGEVTSALQLFADVTRLVTARGLVHGRLPFWGSGEGLDVPGVFSGGSSLRVPGVCPGPRPFIYRQPASSRELEQVIVAAVAEPYAFGLQAPVSAGVLRDWWETKREPLRDAMRAAGLPNVDAYVDGELADYVRGVLFVLYSKRAPWPGESLPQLVGPPSFYERPLVFQQPPQLPFTRGRIDDEPASGGVFAERNALNVPGMFYGAMTDTCGTGPAEAPSSVALDPEYQEFVFRQPRDEQELAEMFNACRVECFDGYGTDGNDHWTPALVRAWWAKRDAHRQAWHVANIPDVDEMFMSELPRYLRRYVFFLEHRRVPNAADELPNL
jgi:hypothetical protein